MTETTRKFMSAMSRVSGISAKNASRIKPMDLTKGDLVLFKDPSRPGFPEVDPEIGVALRIFYAGGEKDRHVGALVVMPVTKAEGFVERTNRRMVVSQKDHKMAMKLNPNYNYRVGSNVEHRKKGNPIDTIRVLPVAQAVLDLDASGQLHKLGKCPTELWNTLDGHFSRFMTGKDAAVKQLGHDVKQTYLHTHDLSYFQQGEKPYDFIVRAEVVTRDNALKGKGPKGGGEGPA